MHSPPVYTATRPPCSPRSSTLQAGRSPAAPRPPPPSSPLSSPPPRRSPPLWRTATHPSHVFSPSTLGYTPKVSFNIFESPAASMFSFTLQVKSAGCTCTCSMRVFVFLCASGLDESGHEALAQDDDEFIVCRGVNRVLTVEEDHNSVREETSQLMLQIKEIQEKRVEYDPKRKLSLILEYILGRITNTFDRHIRPDNVIVGAPTRRGRRHDGQGRL
ncbi:hypothetical protein FB451DRAFT_1054856 [Mycena latifolia]|nr:hypothetical protein FB451DRAFT_1054856 [Mycena latifolia]